MCTNLENTKLTFFHCVFHSVFLLNLHYPYNEHKSYVLKRKHGLHRTMTFAKPLTPVLYCSLCPFLYQCSWEAALQVFTLCTSWVCFEPSFSSRVFFLFLKEHSLVSLLNETCTWRKKKLGFKLISTTEKWN